MKTSVFNPMNKAFSPTSKFLIAGILSVGAAYQASAGSFTYDLRASSITGLGQISDRKTVTGVVIGDIITFDLVAVIQGNDNIDTNDGFQFAYFGIYTSNAVNAVGGALGSSFTGNAATSGFVGAAAFAGPNQGGLFNTDVNADGAPDIGPALTSTTAASYAKTRAAAMIYSGDPISFGFGIGAGVGREYKFGTIQFKVTALNNLVNSTVINIGGPAGLGVTPKTAWQFDNASGSLSTQGIVNATGVSINAITIPEPSAFGMLAIGALGLVGFRRMSLRRTA